MGRQAVSDKPRTRWDAISEELTNPVKDPVTSPYVQVELKLEPRIANLPYIRAYISVDGNVEPVLNFQGQETTLGDPEFIRLYPERAYAQAKMTASFTMRREALLKLLKEEFKLTLCIFTGDVCSDSRSYLVTIRNASIKANAETVQVDVIGRRVS